MNRRTFLKAIGIAIGCPNITPSLPVGKAIVGRSMDLVVFDEFSDDAACADVATKLLNHNLDLIDMLMNPPVVVGLGKDGIPTIQN